MSYAWDTGMNYYTEAYSEWTSSEADKHFDITGLALVDTRSDVTIITEEQ